MTRAVVDQANFTVVYDGEALRDHRMDVRDLAPALLGLAEVFQAAHSVLNPGEPPVSLEIRATDEGSFVAELTLVHQQLVDLLLSRDSLAAAALIALVGGASGVVSFAAKRRRAKRETPLPDGSVRFEMPDGTVITYTPQVASIARQPGARHGVQAAVRPLLQQGIDTMEIRASRDSEPWVTVTDEEAPGLADAMTDDDNRVFLVNEQYDQLLTVVSPNFSGGKWKVRDSPRQAPFWVAMDDPGFVARVDAHAVLFGAQDRLLATVWLRQWETQLGEIQTERSILKVIRHIPATQPVQDAMFGPDGGAPLTD